MNRILLLLSFFISTTMSATTWEVEAGGGPNNVTPYFEPQFITIELGDIVHWTWVMGQHNIVATSGPESFDSGSHTTPFDWSYTFTLDGMYDYECSLFSHANTQFGTITVNPLAVANLSGEAQFDFEIYPNPANQIVTIEKFTAGNAAYSLLDMSGRIILSVASTTQNRNSMNVAQLADGIYIVEMQLDGIIVRKRLLVG